MSLFLVNLAFAGVFLLLAWRAFPRGILFFRLGWQVIHAQSEKPGFRENIRRDIETRQAISMGGGYLLGGLVWLVGGTALAGLGALFAAQAVKMSGFIAG